MRQGGNDMLSEDQVVNSRKAMESMYGGVCRVIENVKIRAPNGAVKFEERVVFDNVPCRLSIQKGRLQTSKTAVSNENLAVDVGQTVKLFLAPEPYIKPNSKIVVTQNRVTTEYTHSGFSARYRTHQEITLVPAQRRA